LTDVFEVKKVTNFSGQKVTLFGV